MNRNRFTVLTGMLLAAAVSRLLPHPPNFTPVAALALFGGASFSDKRTAFLVPLAALLLSDLWLGFYAITPVVYGCFALNVCLGFWLRRRHGLGRIAAAAVTGSVIFFILTNLGVWAFDSLYPKTSAGIAQCYLAAIPFFKNTLAGDLVYSALLFGGLALAEKRWPALADPKPALSLA
jgi:hypothetical protein